jgi:phosphatidylglycerol:prolipoprotein diacylglycerol transferase
VQYPEFDPVAFSIGPLFGWGPLQVRWYGLMYLATFVIAWFGLRARAAYPWSKLKREQMDDVVFYGAIGTIVGGRVGYMLFYDFGDLVANPLSLFSVWQGGMSFHGGLIGVLTAMWLYSRQIRQPFFVLTDAIAPWASFGLFLGRMGNFINGELWGKVTSPDAPWAVIYKGEARHPSQLYEGFLEGLVIFTVLWVYGRKPRPTMATSGLFLTLYGVFRILLEFVRVPDNGVYLALGWVTKGQVLSVPMVLFGGLLLWLAFRAPDARASDAGASAAHERAGTEADHSPAREHAGSDADASSPGAAAPTAPKNAG